VNEGANEQVLAEMAARKVSVRIAKTGGEILSGITRWRSDPGELTMVEVILSILALALILSLAWAAHGSACFTN